MSGLEHEDEFEAYLRHRSVLRRPESPTQGLEPPEDLDKIVLRTAREAIQPPRQMPVYRAPRWALPVGLAAGILLCLSIVLNVSLNTMRRQEAPPQVTSAPAAPAVAPAPLAKRATAEADLRAKPLEAPGNGSTAHASETAPALPAARADPKLWLQRIEALRAQGKIAAADGEWRRFRAAFPDFPATAPPDPPSGTAK
jgi:hypothetical protein